ncbi:hypothetical protein DH2020_041457 [Rehmannia glutinosa]|uniref:65-kDa microtubule-associated protein 1 n=1 Tax=Rehmannia glutinosa TaxID=99300 RepID=A0ABR0UQT5_REHGL
MGAGHQNPPLGAGPRGRVWGQSGKNFKIHPGPGRVTGPVGLAPQSTEILLGVMLRYGGPTTCIDVDNTRHSKSTVKMQWDRQTKRANKSFYIFPRCHVHEIEFWLVTGLRYAIVEMAAAEAENPLIAQISFGETDDERDKMLLQLEQECLDVYRRKVDLAVKSRAHLLQTLADARVELTNLLSALGEKSYVGVKDERIKEFYDVQSQIQKICAEIAGSTGQVESPTVNESDLSLKKLDEFHAQLQDLQKEKSDRLHKVLEFVSTVHDLCAVLGMDFLSTVTDVHPSLNDSTVSFLSMTMNLHAEVAFALHFLYLAFASFCVPWFQKVDGVVNFSSLDEVTIPGALALDLIEQAEVEVERLDKLKASRMKEIAFKRQSELEEIFAHAHIEIDTEAAREKILSLIDSGNVEPTELLADMDNQIVKAKEEALSRKDILDKVEKWMSACEEESWLEDYNRDENRYNASRGAHLNLKRAEKARVLVNKIPALVDSLVAKTRAWEQDRGITFTYDGVPLLAMLDEYAMLRQDREEEKRRMRDQKKFHEQLSKEQDSMFGSTPSPARPLSSTKKVVGPRANGANGSSSRRLSLNVHQNGSRSINRDGKRTAALLLPELCSHIERGCSIPHFWD